MAAVFVVNYETKASTYKAYLLAEDRNDASAFITANMGKEEGFKFTSVEQREDIHAISDRVRAKMGITKTETEVVEKRILTCPWCESTDYETLHALKMHIVKNHADSKKDKK